VSAWLLASAVNRFPCPAQTRTDRSECVYKTIFNRDDCLCDVASQLARWTARRQWARPLPLTMLTVPRRGPMYAYQEAHPQRR
jgi:hypothetical protein